MVVKECGKIVELEKKKNRSLEKTIYKLSDINRKDADRNRKN